MLYAHTNIFIRHDVACFTHYGQKSLAAVLTHVLGPYEIRGVASPMIDYINRIWRFYVCRRGNNGVIHRHYEQFEFLGYERAVSDGSEIRSRDM